jgi:hypothetical protein
MIRFAKDFEGAAEDALKLAKDAEYLPGSCGRSSAD